MAKYHMTKTEREITDTVEMQRILKAGKYAVIAMSRNQEPYIVTLSYGYDEKENTLYFHSSNKGLKLEFLKENPNVCATVIEDRGYKMGQCEHAYASIVLWGQMTPVQNLDEKKHAMDVMLTHLEENPAPLKERIFKNDAVYNNFSLFQLKITEMTGKQGS